MRSSFVETPPQHSPHAGSVAKLSGKLRTNYAGLLTALAGTESTRLGVLRTSVLPDAEGSTGTIFVLRLPNYNRLTDNITIIN